MIKINLGRKGAEKKITSYYRGQIEKAMKMAIVECLSQLTISTPVDTGRARWGWFVTVGVPSSEVAPEAPKGWKGESKGGTAYFAIPDVASRTNITVSADVTAYIANNVPYIVELNNGSSKQQPARFAERSAASGQKAAVRYLKSKG